MRPEMRDLIKKIPKRRGHGKNRAKTVRVSRVSYFPVNLAVLEATFDTGATVSTATLKEKGIIRARGGKLPRVKVLGTGELSKALSLSGVATSASAKAAVEKAGGSVL
jgi:large subunit ribosomal protein L15